MSPSEGCENEENLSCKRGWNHEMSEELFDLKQALVRITNSLPRPLKTCRQPWFEFLMYLAVQSARSYLVCDEHHLWKTSKLHECQLSRSRSRKTTTLPQHAKLLTFFCPSTRWVQPTPNRNPLRFSEPIIRPNPHERAG
ncbi:hypothetical protein TNIN_267321 [Trichonephila inaurata madagascariensis]|uniref:Uncharacterized protein n=1 Tax=Trichonephila inaurata madagascariensis TaxID=2747483 RepID=A0A8X6MD41_9ARAC|nr:hypothetical protein TNIN_267321 [Trichonephila inaurata madagascariensis]